MDMGCCIYIYIYIYIYINTRMESDLKDKTDYCNNFKIKKKIELK